MQKEKKKERMKGWEGRSKREMKTRATLHGWLVKGWKREKKLRGCGERYHEKEKIIMRKVEVEARIGTNE